MNIYLIKATLSGEIQLIFDLISYGADVNFNNKDGITPLRNAIYSGNFDIVKLLLKFVADVNTAERNGLTPLHCAVLKNNVEIVELLIKRGADTELTDKDGFTDLQLAIQLDLEIDNSDIIYTLIQNSDRLNRTIDLYRQI